MFFNSITIFATFLLLLLVPFARAADADCRMMTPGENPNLDDAEALLGKLFTLCHVDPPRLPAMSTHCHPWTYRTAEIRICPPKTLDRHLWSTPVSYDCPSLLATIGSIIEKCRTVVSTGGRMNLEHAQYGYIILTRPGGRTEVARTLESSAGISANEVFKPGLESLGLRRSFGTIYGICYFFCAGGIQR